MTEEKQIKPYRSIEERIFIDSGILEFSKYFVKGAYGVVASLYRFPTFLRKAVNRQLFFQREDIKLFKAKPRGSGGVFSGGGSLGVFIDTGLICYTIVKACNGEYAPLEILAATNFASGFYELGRLHKSKQENLEVKTQQEAQKLQTQDEKTS